MANVTKTKTPEPIPLPRWNDAASVISFLTSIGGVVLAIIEMVDPTGGARAASVEAPLIAGLGVAIAGVSQVGNVFWHRKAQVAAISKQ